jgi:hypothetical protein
VTDTQTHTDDLRATRGRVVATTTRVTGVAIVGPGAISFEHLAKLRGIPDARVVGVCDLSETLATASST